MSATTEVFAVQPDLLYRVSEIKKAMDLGPWAWSSLLAAGLKTCRVGNHHWVRGKDLLDAIEQMQTRKENDSGSS